MPAQRTRDTSNRSLEVTTDAPPPTLAIISPTPRAFTFPININTDLQPISRSPGSSPSSSPGPDLHGLDLHSTSSPSSFFRTLSPASPSASVASSTVASTSRPSHKRRQSTCSDAGSPISDMRPKKGTEGYVKRPENAFILFRRKCCEDRQAEAEKVASSSKGPTEKVKKQRQADLSKAISQQWKSLSPEERQEWEDLAKQKKKEHERLYPDYVYRPQRAKDRKGKKGRDDVVHDEISVVMPWPKQEVTQRNGRSSSMGAAPTTQTIQFPSVYRPSCPGTPSLLPLIERRSSHPGHPEAVGGFDFIPTNSLMPPAFEHGGEMDANMPPDFFQTMFTDFDAPAPSSSQDDGMLLPPHQFISPTSSIESSSSPSSPNQGPYTPTGIPPSSVPGEFSFCGSEDPESRQHLPLSHPSNPIPMLDTSYGEYDFSGQMMWDASEETERFSQDDFDLSSIPPIQLGAPKFGGDEFHYPSPADFASPAQWSSPCETETVVAASPPDNFDAFFDYNGVAASY